MKNFKFISLACISLLFCLQLFGQARTLSVTKRHVDKSSITVILPTINNMIILVDSSINEFKETMNAYGYSPNKEYRGDYYDYCNFSVLLWMYNNNGIGANEFEYDPINNVVVFSADRKWIWPTDCLADLLVSLQPHYTKTEENGIKYYFLETSTNYYGFAVQTGDIVRVSIKKFDK